MDLLTNQLPFSCDCCTLGLNAPEEDNEDKQGSMNAISLMQHMWCNDMLANLSIRWLAKVLLATAGHFNQALLLWSAFDLCVTECLLNCIDCLFTICY